VITGLNLVNNFTITVLIVPVQWQWRDDYKKQPAMLLNGKKKAGMNPAWYNAYSVSSLSAYPA